MEVTKMFVHFDLATALWTAFNTVLIAAIAFIAGHYIRKNRKNKKDEKTLDKS